MELKLKINKNEISGHMFIYLTSAFYILRNSNLSFYGMEFILALAVFSGLFSIIYIYKLNYKLILFLLSMFSFILYLYFRNHDTRMLLSFIAIFVGIKMSQCSILKSLFWSKLFFLVLGMASGGIGHINFVAIQAGSLILIYIIWQNYNMKKLFFLWTIYFILSIYTKSGSFIICIGISLIMVTFLHSLFIKKILCSWFAKYIYPITLILNIFFALWEGERYFPEVRTGFPLIIRDIFTLIIDKIDKLTSWRITLASESLFRYGFSLIGGNIKYYSIIDDFGTYFNLDSGMMWLLQGWGIIMTIIFMVLMIIMMKYLINRKEYYLIIAGISISLWAFNEDMLISVGSNFMFFFIGKILSNEFLYKKEELVYEYS